MTGNPHSQTTTSLEDRHKDEASDQRWNEAVIGKEPLIKSSVVVSKRKVCLNLKRALVDLGQVQNEVRLFNHC